MVDHYSTDWKSPNDLLKYFEKGDLIEIKRHTYMHWVIYVGVEEEDHKIIHYSTESEDDFGGFSGSSSFNTEFSSKLNGSGNRSAHVRKDSLFTVVGHDLCRKNNKRGRSPYSKEVIIERAEAKLNERNYNIITNNCEHFVMWCRYGTHESNQVTICQTAVIGVVAFAVTSSLPVAVVAAGTSLFIMNFGRAVGNLY